MEMKENPGATQQVGILERIDEEIAKRSQTLSNQNKEERKELMNPKNNGKNSENMQNDMIAMQEIEDMELYFKNMSKEEMEEMIRRDIASMALRKMSKNTENE